MASSVLHPSPAVAELLPVPPAAPGAEARVVDLDELAARCTEFRNRGLKVAHCHGCFDLMHPGHIKHFEAAKRFADVLVVTVTPDRFVQKGGNRPAFPETLRAYSIASLACADLVAVNRWPTAGETIRLLRPAFFVKGQEFETLKDPTGKLQEEVAAVQAVGGQMRFTREQVFSSTALLGAHFGLEDRRAEDRPLSAQSRADAPAAAEPPRAAAGPVAEAAMNAAELMREIGAIAALRVCVIGDTIIDEYHHCEPLGMASKSTVVAHRREAEEAHAGGVLAIANHVAELCGQVHLVSVLGAEADREAFVRGHLHPGIEARFFTRPDASSVVKRRYLNRRNGQKLFEINSLPVSDLPEPIQDEVIGYLDKVLPEFDLVLVADYGHGFLGEGIVGALARNARCLAVNAQTNSANAGFNLVTRYPRADIVCIDELEARMAAGSRDGAIEGVARRLRDALDARAFVVTLGSRGCIALGQDGQSVAAAPLHDPRLVDAIGAGDAFLSYCAPAIAAGLPLDMAALLGNAAGALAVQIVGNRRPVRRQELIDYLCAPDGPVPVPPVDSAATAVASMPAAAPSVPAAPTLEPPAAGADAYPDAYYRDFVDRARRVRVTDGSGGMLDFAGGVLEASAAIDAARRTGRKVMFIGNGASAAIASHMAADYAKNGGVRALAFNDAALLTAVSNDIAYEQVFAEPIRLFAEPGDLLVAISSSGRSPNILYGSRMARDKDCRVITLSGFREDNPLRTLGDLNFYVPCLSYGVTEVLHHSLCHCLLDTYLNQYT
jgi:cytidyltransferase-like protein